MRTVRAADELDAAPGPAFDLWADPRRWGGFVEGFERMLELDAQWPAPGAGVVWESGPDGRGRVAERVVECVPGRRLVTDVSEQPLDGGPPRLHGRQALELAELEGDAAVRGNPALDRDATRGDDGSGERRPEAGRTRQDGRSRVRVELRLDYELARGRGKPGRITDLLFVRGAVRDSLTRTLARFAAEAARQAAAR